MNILILGPFNKRKLMTAKIAPVVGDRLDLWYTPLPTVTSRILYPTMETLKALGVTNQVDIIVYLE